MLVMYLTESYARTCFNTIIVLVNLQPNFETNHLRFKEKVIGYLKCKHDELSKSQKLLQLLKLEIKMILKHFIGFNF